MKKEILIIAQAKKKAAQEPHNSKAHYELAQLLEESCDLPGAVGEYGEAVKYNPEFFQAYFDLGIVYTQQKKYSQAVETWQKITDSDGNIKLDKIDYMTRHYVLEKAVLEWKDYLKKTSPNALNCFFQGIAFMFLGELEKAAGVLQKTLDMVPDFEQANYYLGLVLARLDKGEKAVFYLTKELNARPNFIPAIFSLGEVFYKQGGTTRAIEQFEKVIKTKPNHLLANFYLGLSNSKKGVYESAVLSFRKTLQLKPDFAEAHYEIAQIFEKQYQMEQAIKEYNFALQKNPNYREAHFRLALVYKNIGKSGLALEHFQKVINIDTGDGEAHYYTGEVYVQLNKLEQAAKEYKTAISLIPNHIYAHYSLGQAYIRLNKLTQAEEEFKIVLKLNIRDGQARNSLGVVYFGQGKLKQAVAEFQEVLKFNPQDIYAHYYLGACYFKLKDFEKAIQEYQKASELNPSSAYAHFSLGATMSRGGDFEKAVEQFQKATDLMLTSEADLALFSTLQLLAVIGVEHAQQGKRVEQLYSELAQSYKDTVMALAKAVDARDPYTQYHSDRVSRIAGYLAQELNLNSEEIKEIEIAGSLHDIGKLGISDNVLLKKGELTDEEMKIMRSHPEKGAELLENVRLLWNILPLVKYHHERINGSGYPEGLKEDKIPIAAKIIGLADFYDAMTTDRPYRKAVAVEEVLVKMKELKGREFDNFIVDAFLNIADKLPLLMEDLKPQKKF